METQGSIKSIPFRDMLHLKSKPPCLNIEKKIYIYSIIFI